MTTEQLIDLAAEVRWQVLDATSVTGSNLMISSGIAAVNLIALSEKSEKRSLALVLKRRIDISHHIDVQSAHMARNEF